jgi:hypothetical protein
VEKNGMKPGIKLPLVIVKNIASLDRATIAVAEKFKEPAWPVTIAEMEFASDEALLSYCKYLLEKSRVEMWDFVAKLRLRITELRGRISTHGRTRTPRTRGEPLGSC